jgi:hypothetical protein
MATRSARSRQRERATREGGADLATGQKVLSIRGDPPRDRVREYATGMRGVT